MPWLPTLLKLWKARLAFAVRRGSGEGEAHPTICSPPMAPFLWGQGGSSRGAHSFSPAYPTLILEFCLPYIGKQEHLYLTRGSWTRIIVFKGNYIAVSLHL